MTQVRPRWKASDIFTWVGEELRVLEESDVLKNATFRKHWGLKGNFPRDDRKGADHPRNEVKHVQMAKTEVAKDKPTMKGGKGKSADSFSPQLPVAKGKGKEKSGWGAPRQWGGRGKGLQEA
jgi:hypothetical protein